MVVVGRGLDLQHDAEDEQVDEHQDDRVRERPGEAEHRALVLGAQVAAEEAAEELAVAEEVEVDRHPELVYGAAVPPPRSAQSANNRPLPFLPVSIVAPFLALPVTFLVIRALLQSPRASALLSATPTADRWHRATTPTFGGVGIFAGFAAARRRRARLRRRRIDRRGRGDPRRLRDPLRRRPRRRHQALAPARQARGAGGRRGARALERDLGRGRRQRHARLGARTASGSSGSRTRSTCSTTWTGSRDARASSRARSSRSPPRPSTRTATSTSSRRARARVRRLPPVQPAPRQARRPSSWATPAAR